MMSANIRIRFGLQIVFVCLYITPSHYHHCANLSEDIEHKMPGRYILSSVWVRWSIFSQLSIIQYRGLCVFSLPISLVMIEKIYSLSYYHHQIGSMNYYPLFRARSWNNGMRYMSLYILIHTYLDLCQISLQKRGSGYCIHIGGNKPFQLYNRFIGRWLHINNWLRINFLSYAISSEKM